MDIYSFINSRDVAEHCRKLGHKFDARDAAFLVHENKFMDISEKHRAYEEIMGTMADHEICHNVKHQFPEGSFFDNLKRVVEGERALLSSLMTPESGTVYIYNIRHVESEIASYDSDTIYSTYEKAYDELMAFIEIWHDNRDNTESWSCYDTNVILTLEKKWLDTDKRIAVNVNTQGKLTEINLWYHSDQPDEMEKYCDLRDFFDYWIYLPVPFKKGDILCEVYDPEWHSPKSCYNVVVYREICYDGEDEEWIEKRKDRGCSMDMTIDGYFINSDGQIYWNWMHAYHNLEYFRGELRNDARILKTISSMMKGKLHPDQMIYAIDRIRSDKLAYELDEFHNNDYSDEACKDAGIDQRKHTEIKKIII